MRLAAVLALAALLLGTPAPEAGEVGGTDDPRFATARALWLADDDAGSIPAFADLAQAGNRAAQILLALIDKVPALQGPWLAAQPREERFRLMRAPSGRSGESWMQAAATDTPLARLWLELWSTSATVETAMAFAAMGEARAARETLLAIAAHQSRGFAAVADNPGYPDDLRYLIWGEWATDPATWARVETEIAGLAAGDPQRSRHAFRDEPGALGGWLAAAPEAAPLRGFCAAVCPLSAAACLPAAYELAGGQAFLAHVGSPSETLVPTALWEESPRARASLLRAPAVTHPHWGGALTQPCLAAAAFAAANPALGVR